MKTERKWWFKLFCILFISLSVCSLGLNWFISVFQFHQRQEYQLQQSLSFSSSAFFSWETLPIFLSHLIVSFSVAGLISIVIFFFIFRYLKIFIKAKFLLLKTFSSPLSPSDRKKALVAIAHASNPYLFALREGLISILQEQSQENKESGSSIKEPLFSELISRLCRRSAHFYPFLSIQAQINTDIALPVFSSALFQALWELVKNAGEAMGSNPSTRHMAEFHIRSFRDEQWFCCELEDNGPGMSEQEIAQACELYFSTKKSSVGLGLSVVQSVLSRIGGIMKLSSSKKFSGLKVSLFIPLDYMEYMQGLKQMDQKEYSPEAAQV